MLSSKKSHCSLDIYIDRKGPCWHFNGASACSQISVQRKQYRSNTSINNNKNEIIICHFFWFSLYTKIKCVCLLEATDCIIATSNEPTKRCS